MREDPRGGELVRIRAWTPGLARYVGSTVVVGVRPEDLVVQPTGAIPATVVRRIPVPTGSVLCSVGGAMVMATAGPSTTVTSGDAVHLRIDHLVAFDRATDLAIT
jgi:hypothetical protein